MIKIAPFFLIWFFAIAQIAPLSVPNMAALRTVVPNPTKPVYVEGYYRQGDGGGGYYWVTNTVAGANAYGGRILAAGGGKSWQLTSNGRVNAMAFGLVSTEIVDNSPYLQAAVYYAFSNNVPIVEIPSGSFWVSNRVWLPPRVSVYGQGSRSCIDMLADASVLYAVTNGNTAALQTNVALWGNTMLFKSPGYSGPFFELDTNLAYVNALFSTNTLNDGTVVPRYQMSSAIRNLGFYGCNNIDTNGAWNQHAIKVPYPWDFEISNCSFVRIKGSPAWCINANGFRFERNAMFGSSIYGSKGLIHWHGSDSHISGNYMFGGRGPGLWISQEGGWLNGDLVGNYFGNFDEFGYKTTTGISGNVMTTSSAHELETGDMVTVYPVTLGDSLPAPLSEDVTYYAIKISATEYSLSTNHTTATTLTISGSYSNPFYVCPGPANGVYMNDGAKGNTIIGGRCDQNYDQGIRFAGAARNTVLGTVLKQNGYKTSTGAQRSGTNVAGITFTSSSVFGCTDNRTIGVITTVQPVAREFLGSAADNAPIGPVDNNADVTATDYFLSSLTSLNYQIIGATNAGTALEISGGAAGANILRMNRAFTASVGMAISGNGVSFASGQGAVWILRDATNNLDLIAAEPLSTVKRFTVGSRSTQSSPTAGQIQLGESASGSNVSGANGSIRVGIGTGSATGANLNITVPISGSSGTSAQSTVDALRVQQGTETRDSFLLLYDADAASLRRVGVTNLDVGDGVTRSYLYLK